MASPVTPPLSQTDDDVEMQKTTAAAVVKHEIVMLGESTRAITERIEGLETALEDDGKRGVVTDRCMLYDAVTTLRRERNHLLEKENQLQQRLNLCMMKEYRDRRDSKCECEDGRILQRLDSFNTLINVSTLTAGFALLGLAFVELPTTRVMMLLTFILEAFTALMLSMISSYARQAYNHGSAQNSRAARYLHSVRWITFIAQAFYAVGFLLFVGGVLVESTVVHGQHWVLPVSLPILCLGLWCWVVSTHALLQLRMGVSHGVLLFDADYKVLRDQRSTAFPAQTSFYC